MATRKQIGVLQLKENTQHLRMKLIRIRPKVTTHKGHVQTVAHHTSTFGSSESG